MADGTELCKVGRSWLYAEVEHLKALRIDREHFVSPDARACRS